MDTKDILTKAEAGFKTLSVNASYQKAAINHLTSWLTESQYSGYLPQIKSLVDRECWDYLLDSFYQVIPFGTGGRRGEVGIGPNRINPVTIRNSAQGHSQYLLNQYGDDARERGVVLAYDVREFGDTTYLRTDISNPIQGLTSQVLAHRAAEVYAANGIKVFLFGSIRTTPELSFAIRHLKAAGGDMFSASHNPPAHNGKKVYDEYGGQLIPPHDEALVSEVTQNVSDVRYVEFEEGRKRGLIEMIGEDIDKAYIDAASGISRSDARDIKIVYSPLHGTGLTSVSKILDQLGFTVLEDPKTRNPSGMFENVTYQIPNPEVIESFDSPLRFARAQEADVILSTDPDADRMGIMVKHDTEWIFLNGNEIAIILAEYAARRIKTPGRGVIIKTVVTTGLIERICDHYDLELVGDLLIGFKYVGDVMNRLETEGRIDNFLLGAEESHGYLSGNYARDKDAATGAVWLCELAAELKRENKTLVDFLNDAYARYGYFRNYLTEIRMLGATGQERIRQIQHSLRTSPPTHFGRFKVETFEDYMTHEPIVSETDRAGKDILVFKLSPQSGASSIKVTVRPSGTEPKIKMYFEIGCNPTEPDRLKDVINSSEPLLKEVEKAVLLKCYEAIGVEFPERGFLLFWQLPLDAKLKYFEVEPQLADLKSEQDKEARKHMMNELLSFLGSDAVQKVDKAFSAQYKQPLLDYLELN
jgi:phosphoglucomutase